MRGTGIKIVGATIKCDNLEIAVFVNRVEYKKKEITQYKLIQGH
jgi:hypothetical protein